MNNFRQKLIKLEESYQALITRPNKMEVSENGVFNRYQHPIITAAHIPLSWRYDFGEQSNPFLLERFGFNATFNAGAIKWNDKYVLVVRVEGKDRKSFFAVAESPNGIDNFSFWKHPVQMPENSEPDGNIYDMRLTRHEDGWIYGIFCTERKDPAAPPYDQSMAVAACGIARTKNMIDWQRLPDLQTPSPQQRNVVLHPEFVNGQYAFYTRPQDGFINTGTGGGIAFGLCPSIENAVIDKETIIDHKIYHTVYEAKNGQGPTPIKTREGWLHLAHGVRNTAAGLRYVLYMFMTDLHDLTRITYKPGGYFLAPEGEERVGDVSNVVFCNGWIEEEDGTVFIYYASSDTRMHVATTTVEKLLDYVMHTPPDAFSPSGSVATINSLVLKNASVNKQQDVVLNSMPK